MNFRSIYFYVIPSVICFGLALSFVHIGNYNAMSQFRLNATVFSSLEVTSSLECTMECSKKPDDCFSFNVRKLDNGLFLCELLNATKYAFSEKMLADNDFVHYYDKNAACKLSPCEPLACFTNSNLQKLDKLYVCECVAGKNYALGKPTSQSSKIENAHCAVDGSRQNIFNMGSCTHTLTASTYQNIWWRVDMLYSVPVSKVTITNRNANGERLSNFEIKIGDSLVNDGLSNPKCGDRHAIEEGLTETIVCEPAITGRYLVIQSFHHDELTLCEVEVYLC